MSRWALALLVGCTKQPPPPTTPIEAPLFTMSEHGFGPLAQTPATLVALRKTFAGYEVVPVNNDGLEYRVSQGGTKLFDVIPDETGHVLNVHAVTPKVVIDGSPWRIGHALAAIDELTVCECWADQTVCFRPGEHVAIALAKVCREGAIATYAARKTLVGVPIRTAIWSARPLAPGGYASPATSADEADPP